MAPRRRKAAHTSTPRSYRRRVCPTEEGSVAYSFRRGISSARLHGRVRKSSCEAISLSQPVAQAFEEPGRQKRYVAFATPARQRDCRLEGPISSYEIARNSSP